MGRQAEVMRLAEAFGRYPRTPAECRKFAARIDALYTASADDGCEGWTKGVQYATPEEGD